MKSSDAAAAGAVAGAVTGSEIGMEPAGASRQSARAVENAAAHREDTTLNDARCDDTYLADDVQKPTLTRSIEALPPSST